MDELQRMKYLDAMGVDSFVPRFLLSTAKTPVLCPLMSLDEGVQNSGSLAPGDANSETRVGTGEKNGGAHFNREENTLSDEFTAAEQEETLAKRRLIEEVSNAPATAVASESTRAENVADVRFSLALWRPNDHIIVIDSRRSGDALPTHTLLSNMLQSLGLLDINLPAAEVLNWPMVNGAHDTSWSAAKEMVLGFLEGKVGSQKLGYILLFGEDSCLSVMGKDFAVVDKLYHCATLAQWSSQAVILPSLTEILYRSDLKKKVWYTLRRLSKIPRES